MSIINQDYLPIMKLAYQPLKLGLLSRRLYDHYDPRANVMGWYHISSNQHGLA